MALLKMDVKGTMGENLEQTQVSQDSVQSWDFMKLLWADFSLRIHLDQFSRRAD